MRSCLPFLALMACAAELSEKERTDARLQYDLGVDHLSRGNLTGALAALTSSEKIDADFPDLHNALGLANAGLQRYEEAESHFKRALELKPGYSDVRNNLGTLYMVQAKYDKAIEQFKIALQDVLYGTPSHAEGNLGYAYYRKGERVTAIKHIKNATLVNPKFCRGYLWLGEIYQAGREWRDAERYLDRFVERCLLDPQLRAVIDAAASSEAYMRLGQVTLAAGNAPRAKSAFQQCIDAGRDTPYFDTCDRQLRQIR